MKYVIGATKILTKLTGLLSI